MSSFASSAEIRNKRKGRSLASPTDIPELSNLVQHAVLRTAKQNGRELFFGKVCSPTTVQGLVAKLQRGDQIVLSRNWQFKFRTEAIER